MLIKREVLDRIVAGEIDLVFRRWKRPTVAAGGTLRTSVGLLGIDAVDLAGVRSITVADAQRAGYETKAKLVRELDRREGEVYRIAVRFAGDDPRLALREDADLPPEDVAAIGERLAGYDTRSAHGPWTMDTLRLLADNPHVRAEDLAAKVGLDKPTFKNNVRKLKTLGLTISHSPGYELSPRGAELLRRLNDTDL